MDQFSYLSVLLSLIVGLAITQILKGYRGIVLSRTRIQMYWPTLLWSASLLLMNVQSWWASFDLRNVEVWTFAAFSVVLAQTILQYMLAALVFPDFFGNERIDLRAHYWEHTCWVFLLFIGVLLTSLAKDLVISGHLTNTINLTFHLIWIGLALLAVLIRREWYHQTLAATTAISFCAYIVLLFARLH